MKKGEPRPWAGRIADAALVAVAAMGALEGLFSARAGRGAPFVLAPVVAGVALLAARARLSPPWRVRLAIAVSAALIAALGVEIEIGRRDPRDGTFAARRGLTFDARSVWDVVHDERRAGVDAYPSLEPRALLRRGFDVGGSTLLPLGGVSGKKIILCNEGGSYATYESDEHGFNNPKGIWGSEPGGVEVGIVGEAFMQGACVPRGAGAADVIRETYPATLNLGISGNGPLLELAGILEYLADVKPKIVLWSYYDKDLFTLEAEKASPVLSRYLDEPGFRQGLAAQQAPIDRALMARAKLLEAGGATWPGALDAVGLTRRRTPMWLEDLVMGQDHSSVGAVMRLDRLNGFLAARLGPKQSGPPPDLVTFERVLEKAKAVVSGWGGSLHFVYLADVHNLRGPEHPLREPVLDAVRAADIPIIDLQPVFARQPDPLVLRYHQASHCNEEGYRLIGRTVVDALRGPAARTRP